MLIKSKKVQRFVFTLKRGEKFFMDFKINGGKNDIDFWMADSKNKTTGHASFWIGIRGTERIVGKKTIELFPEVSGKYYFYFSNSFSLFTSKEILVSYQLENKQRIRLKFIV